MRRNLGFGFMLMLATAGCGSVELPAATSYRIEPLLSQVSPDREAEVLVRIVRVSDSQPVRGAVFTEHRFVMWMSPAHRVNSTLMVEGSNPPPVIGTEMRDGVYRIHAPLPMRGNWQATLVARVPGEPLPVRGSFSLTVR